MARQLLHVHRMSATHTQTQGDSKPIARIVLRRVAVPRDALRRVPQPIPTQVPPPPR
jgi:hypothetical protein